MSVSAKQQTKHATSILAWVSDNFSGKEFSTEELVEAFAEDKSKKVKFPTPNKPKKDPNKPKKGNSAWIFFTNDMREKVKGENPDAKTTELTTIMSPLWKALTDEEKKPYQEMADADKVRYEKEMEGYKSSETESDSEGEVKPKAKAKKKVGGFKFTLRAHVMKEQKEKINQLCSDNAVDGKNANFMQMVTKFIEDCTTEEREELQSNLDKYNESL